MSNEKKSKEVSEAAFNPFDVFSKQAKTNELPEGIHENIRVITIDPNPRKDKNKNTIKKQLYIKFKKFDDNNRDIGEKEISFFVVDPLRDSALSNLHTFIAQVREVLGVFLSDAEITAGYDPLSVLVTEDDKREMTVIKEDYKYDVIKKRVLKKSAAFKAVEAAVAEQTIALLKGKTGFDSEYIRLKLEKDGEYVQIPRYERFLERSSVEEKDSPLYNAK